MSVRNGEFYLAQAIDSLIAQSLCNFELIVIDDASNDGTPQLLESYFKRDRRIRIVRNSENRGLAQSLNLGLEYARGKYIARMDADDISLPNRLEKQVLFLENNPTVGVLGTATEIIDAKGNRTGFRIYPTESILIRWRLGFENPLCHPSVMIRKSLFDICQYNPHLTTAQDYDLWCRMAAFTKIANLDEPLLRYRKHDNNLTYQRNSEQRQNSVKISQSYLTDLLHKAVGLDTIQPLWQYQSLTHRQLLILAELLEKSAHAVLAEQEWNQSEKLLLCKCAIRRIIEMTRSLRRDPGIFIVFWRVLLIYSFALRKRIIKV